MFSLCCHMARPAYYAFFLCGYTAWLAYFDIFDVWPGLASSKEHFFRCPHCAIFCVIDRFLGSIDRSLVPLSGHIAWPASYDIIFVWPRGLASLLRYFFRVATRPGQLTTTFSSCGHMAWPAYNAFLPAWLSSLASLL